MMHVILASGSPRRSELLARVGLRFEVVRPDVDESTCPGEAPMDYARRVSLAKAGAVVEQNAVVIAADTIVAHRGDILGKPATPEEAAQMLRRLRGEVHHVYTAIALAHNGRCTAEITTTVVPMRAYSDTEIAAYVASGAPMDKAGAYGIQSQSFKPAPDLTGCYGNVMGLPLCTLARMLAAFDVALPGLPAACRAPDNTCGLR